MRRSAFIRNAIATTGTAVALTSPVLSAEQHYERAAIDIEEFEWEIGPGIGGRISGYGGVVPGKLLRYRQGSNLEVTVRNHTRSERVIHWHGLSVAPQVDGVMELGTPTVPPGGLRTYHFIVTPSGTRWYHAHIGDGAFQGEFGPLIVEPSSEPGRYDREVVLMLHEWFGEPAAQESMMDDHDADSPSLTEAAPNMQMSMNMPMSGNPHMGMRDYRYRAYSINGKMLGHGEPIRVRRGDRVLFRVINASATLTHRLALSRHAFQVLALDGNPIPVIRTVPVIELGPGERIDALVDMTEPGTWIFGSTEEKMRQAGMGIAIEYAGSRQSMVWDNPMRYRFSYHRFGLSGISSSANGERTITLDKLTTSPDAWGIDGAAFPDARRIDVRYGQTYLWHLENHSMMEHPMHLHGHTFDLIATDEMNGIRGIHKDTVVVRPGGRTTILVHANNPARGSYLFHCHNEQHVAGGMAVVMHYVT